MAGDIVATVIAPVGGALAGALAERSPTSPDAGVLPAAAVEPEGEAGTIGFQAALRSDGVALGASPDFAANRARGRVSLTLVAAPDGARRSGTREDGSLRVRFPKSCDGISEAVLVNTAGGIAGGDRFGIDIDLGPGAKLAVTTASAEKIYRTHGPDAIVEIAAHLGEGAELLWLPHETIMFDAARLVRRADIRMAADAALVFVEAVVFGRAAMGEAIRTGSFQDRWRVRRGGRLVFAESFRLDGAIQDRLGEAAVARGHQALATMLLVPGNDGQVNAVRAAAASFAGEVGISAFNGIALARLAAPDGAAIRQDLMVLLAALGRTALPRIWLN